VTTRRGIVACGTYVPRLRLTRAAIAEANAWMRTGSGTRPKGARSFCNWDEDAVTMAVEAARGCLSARDRAAVRGITLASTTLPFADRANAGIVAAALDLPADARVLDACGSQRAGTSALLAALDGSGPNGDHLIAASDRRLAKPGSPQEQSYGHGAVALLVGTDDLVAEMIGGAAVHDDMVDHYRGAGEPFDYTLEERWVRDLGHMKVLPEAIGAALKTAGVEPAAVTRAILPVPGRTAQSLAKRIGLATESLSADPAPGCGDIGVGHSLLRLARCLEDAQSGNIVVLAGFGQGADAIVLRVADGAPGRTTQGRVDAMLGRSLEETHYTRFLAHCGLLEVDFGMRAERDNRTAHSASYRRQRDLTAFIGGRCTRCGTVQFPRSSACVTPECRAFDTQVDHPLAETHGRVKSFTEDWLAYTARPPFVYGNVALEGGGNAFIEFADTMAGELAIGREVEFVFRIKDVDRLRRFHRYFWKAKPAGG
jgi:3-hydroxy-3-methylglutaryl CoA synthase